MNRQFFSGSYSVASLCSRVRMWRLTSQPLRHASTSSPMKVTGQPTTTPSGLQYWDIVVGTGATAAPGNTVKVHYSGFLTTGEKFDSSRDRGEPFSFPLGGGQVIKGWDEGVAGMKVGGQRQLRIPPQLGYGADRSGRRNPAQRDTDF